MSEKKTKMRHDNYSDNYERKRIPVGFYAVGKDGEDTNIAEIVIDRHKDIEGMGDKNTIRDLRNTISYVKADASLNTNDGKARQFATKIGFKIVRYLGMWNSYEVYQPLGCGEPPKEPISKEEYESILDELIGGCPPLVLVTEKEIRFSSDEETIEFWDSLRTIEG